MNSEQIFDLEKIKEITSPIEELQGRLFGFEDNIDKFIKYKNDIIKQLHNQELIEQIQTINQIL